MTRRAPSKQADRGLRFGLVGTGHWARTVPTRALASSPHADLVAVWGRSPEKAAALAHTFGARAYSSADAMFEAVDAVAFAIPPAVQPHLAERAARAGCHLLLEKPIAIDTVAGNRLVGAAEAAGVSSVVFFKHLFLPERSTWIGDVSGKEWHGSCGLWLSGALLPDSPFNTPWRRERGVLWDMGPHALAAAVTVLGPVQSVTAQKGNRDVVQLMARHTRGGTSVATLSLTAASPAKGSRFALWGEPGVSVMPPATTPDIDAYHIALAELVDNARAGQAEHPYDVHFGAVIADLLSGAELKSNAREEA